MHFCFVKSPTGLLPRLIQRFKDKRAEYKREQEKVIALSKELEKTRNGLKEVEEKVLLLEAKIKMWDRRQYNVKKNTNAIYGVMDYPKFRLHRAECTQATAVLGRISAECEYEFLPYVIYEKTEEGRIQFRIASEIIEGAGYKLLYGDTDSFFVLAKSRNKDDLLEEGKKLRELLNDHLSEYFSKTYGIPKAPAELGFKAIYSWIMFIGKKNYAAEYIWDEKRGWKTGLDIKGIASVRSDASRVEKAALETLIGMLPPSKNNNDEILEAYIAGVLKDFDDHKYSPMDMAYPAQLKKPLKKNNKGEWIINQVQKLSVKAHYKSAIYSNYFLNTEYLQGDKPRRLPVKFPKLKTAKGQQTLAKTSAFPTEFTYRGKIKKKDGSIITDKVYEVTDISITEDMTIPAFFLANIDYQRIRDRLEQKLRIIMCIHQKKEYVKPKKEIKNGRKKNK